MYVVRRRGPGLFGLLLMLITALVVILLLLGWWRNWYDVSAGSDERQAEVGVRIHREEVERDLGRVRDETRRLTESAQAAADHETLEGTVAAVSSNDITVREGEREHIVLVDEVTRFLAADDETDQKLVEGDRVRVTYQESEGRKRAARVTILDQ